MREALSLANWVVAALVARGASSEVSEWLAQWIDTPSIRYAVAFAALMLASLIIGGVLIGLVVRLVRASGLGFADRLLGLVFGFARGVLLVLLGLALVRFGLPVEEDSWWQSSMLVPIFNVGLDWILPKLLALAEGLTDSVT